MDTTDSSSPQILSKLFEHLSKWRKTKEMKIEYRGKFNWSPFHLSVVHDYVLKLNITAYSHLLESATLLNEEFSDKLPDNSVKHKNVASFMEALHEIFAVPQKHQLFERDAAIKKNGLVAAFIDMLLRLIHNCPVGSVEDRLRSLEKGLRFLVGVLGDESFIYNVQDDLWAEFEAAGYKAGTIIHLIIFSTKADLLDERFSPSLLRRMDQFEVSIINLSNLKKSTAGGNINRKTAPANSIFDFTSVLDDLEDVLNRKDAAAASVKGQIKTLHQKLKLFESLIKHADMKYAMRIRDLAYEAKYLINSFLDGDGDSLQSHSRKYLSMRLSHVLRKINSLKWRDSLQFKRLQFHVYVILGYALKLKTAPGSTLLSTAALLNEEFSNGDEVQENSAEHELKVASSIDALHEVLTVPQHHQLFERDAAIKKNGLVAAFVDMLLRLLHNWPIGSVDDRLDSLRKGLKFILGVLGDESFIYNVQDHWPEFEAVANKAGTFVHLIILSTKANPIDEGFLDTLLRRMGHLKDKIVKLSKQQQGIDNAWITRKTPAGDSLFIVDSLLHDFVDVLNRKDDTIADVKDQIKTLKQELENLKSKIKHPEMEELKEYVVRIRDSAFEAEYLINYFLDGDTPHSQRYLRIRLSHVIRKIKSIELGIKGINYNHDNDVARFSQLSLQTNSSRDATVSEIIGLEDKEVEILQYLDGGKEDRQIVSIVGMPGLGKTTLARKFYHHPSLKERFDQWSWCVVSQQYEMKSVLIDILGTLTNALSKEEMLNIPEESLKIMIHQCLYQRRYLIILDDLWSSDPWRDLQSYFPDNGNGSRILLTSRNRNVAPEESIMYELPPMSDEHCWQLLRNKVFQIEYCPPKLLKLGRQIAKNCRGLPLAVVVTAGILSSKDTQEESTWKQVEANLASYLLSDESNSIMRIVELSYNNLPDHLKPCFLYFGAYRKRKQIAIGHLLRLWIAEGFMCREDRKRAESAAEIHLKELIDRSLVTVSKTSLEGRVKACYVHDLLHEFCLRRCEEENLHTLVDKNYSIFNEKHQRFCIRDYVSSPKLPLFGLHVRSILGCFPRSGFLNMKLLRTLVLQGVMCHDGLNEIKFLVNLRCLIIGYGSSSSKLDELKLALISSLINLEFLQVKSQFYLVYTPSEIAKMVKLRHVTVDNAVRFGEESNTLSQTNILEFLSKITIQELKDEQMLRCSPNLRQLKCKCFPLEEKDKGELRYPDFSFFTQLESLQVEAGVVHKMADIYLPLNVKELTLSGLYLPWKKISEIGRLQNLQFLKLQFSASDGEVWETRDEEFQQLRWLTIKSFYDLKEWRIESRSHFPKLGWLVLDDCMNLLEIPAALSDITTLEMVEIKGHSQDTLVESIRQIEEEQQESGDENPKFQINIAARPTSETASSFFFSLFS